MTEPEPTYTHGGKRPGSGRPRLSQEEDSARITVTVPLSLRAYFMALGDGNLSEGVRRAGEYHKESQSPHVV
jgi:hypothetical protein